MAPRTLAQLRQDPRIASVRHEGADGWWADLSAGYETYEGCTAIRGDTVKALISRLLSDVQEIIGDSP